MERFIIVRFSVFPFGQHYINSTAFLTLCGQLEPALLGGFVSHVQTVERKQCQYDIELVSGAAFFLEYHDDRNVRIINIENGECVMQGRETLKASDGFRVEVGTDHEPPEYWFATRPLNRLEMMGLGLWEAEHKTTGAVA